MPRLASIHNFFMVAALLSAGFFVLNFSNQSAMAQVSPDAIAVRTVPNLDHYSPIRWYLKNIKEQGQPQSLLVDGYEAVRDGRTVYVNAANVDAIRRCENNAAKSCNVSTECGKYADGTQVKCRSYVIKRCSNNKDKTCAANSDCGSGGTCLSASFYTNIYIISYTQAAEPATVDILGQILKNWRFNINLANDVGQCENNADINCTDPGDCPAGDSCSSIKSKVVRDTRRLSDLAEIKIFLENYKTGQGNHYPILQSGTYLKNKTVSVWPSWQENFSGELGLIPLPSDPINKLGLCIDNYPINNTDHKKLDNLRFDAKSCWDEKTKQFADSNLNDPDLDLPFSSRAYVYSTNANGSNYNLCAVMESGFISDISTNACKGSAASPNNIRLADIINNHAPELNGNIPEAHLGKVYEAEIFATDQDDDEIIWTKAINFINPDDWRDGWGTNILSTQLTDTKDANRKLLKAQPAHYDSDKTYSFEVTVKDARNATKTKRFDVNFTNRPPIIQDPGTQNIPIGNNLNLTLTALDKDNDLPLTFTLDERNMNNLVGPSLSFTRTQTALTISGPITKAGARPVDFSHASSFPFTFPIVVADKLHSSSNFTLNLNVTDEPPVFNEPLACPTNFYLGDEYKCDISVTEPDAPSHKITFNISGLPGGVNYTPSADTYTLKLTGKPNITLTGPTVFHVSVDATDQYQATANKTFNINIDSWCGDGRVSYPQEDCDLGIKDIYHQCLILKNHYLKDLDNSDLECPDNMDANHNPNMFTIEELTNTYESLCSLNCKIGCTNDIYFRFIGSGCYLDTLPDKNNNGIYDAGDGDGKYTNGECTKGIYKCDAQSDKVVCVQPKNWKNNFYPSMDYCCSGTQTDKSNLFGQMTARTPNPGVDIVDITIYGNGSQSNPYVYRTCDEICRDYGRQQGYTKPSVCIGVGFVNNIADAKSPLFKHDECVGSVHDEGGGTCSLAQNQAALNCRSLIFFDSWGRNYGTVGFQADAAEYLKFTYPSFEECDRNSVMPEYHDLGYKPELGEPVATRTTSELGKLYTKRPCIFLPANTPLATLGTAKVQSDKDVWWKAYFNKTSSGNWFCTQGKYIPVTFYNQISDQCTPTTATGSNKCFNAITPTNPNPTGNKKILCDDPNRNPNPKYCRDISGYCYKCPTANYCAHNKCDTCANDLNDRQGKTIVESQRCLIKANTCVFDEVNAICNSTPTRCQDLDGYCVSCSDKNARACTNIVGGNPVCRIFSRPSECEGVKPDASDTNRKDYNKFTTSCYCQQMPAPTY